MAARGYLVRRSRKPNNSNHKPSKAHRKKKIPPWDSTISNLLVHKPTKAELKRRHELHQPVERNSDSYDVSEQLYPSGHLSGSEMRLFKTPESTKDERFSVLREIMDTNEKLQNALTYSDKRVAAVEDMFGDDPKKYRGFPNVTCAPIQNKVQSESKRVFPVAFMKETSLGATNLDILSDTIMDGTALNDVLDRDEDIDENNNAVEFQGYVSPGRTDIEKGPRNSEQPAVTHPLSVSAVTQHPVCTSQRVVPRPNITDDEIRPEIHSSRVSSPGSTLLASAPDIQEQNRQPTRLDVNYTGARPENERVSGIRTDSKLKNSERETTSVKPKSDSTSSFKGLHDLRQMVDNLEDEVRKYEEETGREKCSPTVQTKGKESFAGFTVSILNAVTKLVGYLRECESQRKTDLSLKEGILFGFQQQQVLIDALTNDVVCLQEENKKLRYEVETSRKGTDEQMMFLKRELYSVLKSHEYQTLSEDIDFLYDVNPPCSADSPPSTNSHTGLADVVKNHGFRDKLEYLPSKVKNDASKFFSAQNVSPTQSLTTGKITPVNRAHASIGETTTSRDSTKERVETVENVHVAVPIPGHSINTVSRNDQDLVSPTSSLETSGQFTYSNPTTSNDTRNEPLQTTTSPPSHPVAQQDYELSLQPSVFLGRNQSMSPHRYSSGARTENSKRHSNTTPSLVTRFAVDSEKGQADYIDKLSKLTLNNGSSCSDPHLTTHVSLSDDIAVHDVYSSSQSRTSPAVSPIFYERQPHPGLTPATEKVAVTLPTMWQDADSGTQNNPVAEKTVFAPVTFFQKKPTTQKTDTGWFALSSHVDYS